jgi:hypothetical protein
MLIWRELNVLLWLVSKILSESGFSGFSGLLLEIFGNGKDFDLNSQQLTKILSKITI